MSIIFTFQCLFLFCNRVSTWFGEKHKFYNREFFKNSGTFTTALRVDFLRFVSRGETYIVLLSTKTFAEILSILL